MNRVVTRTAFQLTEEWKWCVAWNEWQRHRPGADRDARGFRSEELKSAARLVFPQSCHTAGDGRIVTRMQRFVELRKKAVRGHVVPDLRLRGYRPIARPTAKLHIRVGVDHGQASTQSAELRVSEAWCQEQALAEQRRGRSLLLLDWSASLFDGALAGATEGFFDEDGMPPWDLWLAILPMQGEVGSLTLLVWIPFEWGGRVDEAVGADAASSLAWCQAGPRGKLTPLGWGERWKLPLRPPVRRVVPPRNR